MEYTITPGQWKTVFAVPAEVVDKHIRVCGAASLRALLIVLRCGGTASEEAIASQLAMEPSEVRDAMRYWTETGVLSASGAPASEAAAEQPLLSPAPQSQETQQPAKQQAQQAQQPRQTPPAGVTSYRGRPSREQIAAMMEKDPNIEFLFQSAAEQLGKYLHLTDRSSLIYLYDYAGIPIDVILMVIQYCCSIGKKQMRYIERVALDWLDAGVTSLEAAEAHIHKLEEQSGWEKEVKNAFGIRDRELVEKEMGYVQKWYQEYHSGIRLIRLAYERTIENIGKLSFPYIDSILKSWHEKKITTPEQVFQERAEREKAVPVPVGASSPKSEASYDLDEIDQLLMNAAIESKNKF